MNIDQCIFCQIAHGNLPSHQIWENRTHLAFLSIYPNMEGVTVIIPKKHKDGYIFNNSPTTISGLMAASKKVATMLEKTFPNVGRIGLVLEGLGVNHLHAKLYPLHGTTEKWQKTPSTINTYYKKYPGYISSHDGKKASDQHLATIASAIQANKN